MQQLSSATNGGSAGRCASLILEAVPPVNWFIRREMRTHRRGLSVPQFRTLVLVERETAANLSLVADFLGSSLPTASRIVAGLVKKGFIQRKGCVEDRRQLALALTARGHSVLSSAMEQTHAELMAEVDRFTAQDRAVVSAAMSILMSRFGSLTSARIKPENVAKTEMMRRGRKPAVLTRA